MSRDRFIKSTGDHTESLKPSLSGTGWTAGKMHPTKKFWGDFRAQEDAGLLCACGNKALSKQLRGKLPPIGYCRKCKPTGKNLEVYLNGSSHS